MSEVQYCASCHQPRPRHKFGCMYREGQAMKMSVRLSTGEYTPTTEQMRAAYRHATQNSGWDKWDEATVDAEFNRWLAQYEADLRTQIAAHPEPKPWHSAQPGDVWLLTINDEQGPAISFLDKNTGQTLFATPTFTDLEQGRHLITGGHRIWPKGSTMSDHDCPGLFKCRTHPRWRVFYFWDSWLVYRSGTTLVARFPTHAEAINYAQKEATK